MSVRYTRRFHPYDSGPDVEAVGRALCRAGVGIPFLVYAALPLRVRRTWGPRKQDWLRRFKKKRGLPVDAIYGPKVHVALSPFFDARGRSLMQRWEEPVKIVEPRQGRSSLVSTLWEAYSIGRTLGLSDLGTYNGASRLPSGTRSDHAYWPAYAYDLGVSPTVGYAHPVGKRYFKAMTERPEIEYVILGDRIWSRGKGLHAYTSGGHENHVHVSGRHSWYDKIKGRL
jgi:hypothetical protein